MRQSSLANGRLLSVHIGRISRIGPISRISQLPAITALFCLALCLATTSPVLAQDGAPAIQNFQVTWAEENAELNTYRFTFTGKIVNCEDLTNPIVKLLGYPFEAATVSDSTGAFSVEIVESADVGFGRTIIAVIQQDGVDYSEPAYTST